MECRKLKYMIVYSMQPYAWAYQWFFHALRLKKLETYFSKVDKNEQYSQFCMFAKMAGLRDEVWLIEDYLRLDIAVKWCEEHGVPYHLDIPKGYQKDYPEAALKYSVEKIPFLLLRGVL